ncbi:unnamed protein product [Fraxinus pennsylvanica]|uniref:GOST seven transmembrane domain-containing protein n=1 Tax=Fraxinus pennsylvanica TaxID=56036 RepID=A0AAD1Z724_9LAMI|nr:unnamed protein product [Fraxinus pennsylvanica]
MGHSVMKPTLRGITSKIILLGAVYFVDSEALELVKHLGISMSLSKNQDSFWCYLLHILMHSLLFEFFSSLSKNLEKLQVMVPFDFYAQRVGTIGVENGVGDTVGVPNFFWGRKTN